VIRVEIRNTHKKNQGAQLMLRATLERLRAAAPGRWRFAVAGRCATPETRRELDLDLLPWVQRWGTHADLLARLVPPLGPRRLARAADLDVILDASGFAYGDQWGPDKARMAAAYLGRARRRGARVILLPQALGPFEGDAIRQAFSEVLTVADRVYARDPTSLAAARDLPGAGDHLRLCPDFTHSVRGVPPTDPLPPETVGLIPNRKMLEMGAAGRDAYVGLFTRLAGRLVARGARPMLLLHSAEDRALAAAIADGVGHALPVREEGDPLRVKGLIAGCHAVVSSRFHGLVNALSAGVPAVATGWSHKYEHLMGEFDCPDLLITAETPEVELDRRLDAILSDPGRGELVARLVAATRRQVAETDRMWDDVLDLIHAPR